MYDVKLSPWGLNVGIENDTQQESLEMVFQQSRQSPHNDVTS